MGVMGKYGQDWRCCSGWPGRFFKRLVARRLKVRLATSPHQKKLRPKPKLPLFSGRNRDSQPLSVTWQTWQKTAQNNHIILTVKPLPHEQFAGLPPFCLLCHLPLCLSCPAHLRQDKNALLVTAQSPTPYPFASAAVPTKFILSFF